MSVRMIMVVVLNYVSTLLGVIIVNAILGIISVITAQQSV